MKIKIYHLVVNLKAHKRAIFPWKILVTLMLFNVLQIKADVKAQVTLESKNLNLGQTLTLLKKTVGYDFLYNSQHVDLNENVEKSFRNVSLTQILDDILTKEGYSYEINKKTIIITNPRANPTYSRSKQQGIAGRVISTTGEGIAGVTVSLKDGSEVTTTDQNGFFSLKTIAEKPLVVFTAVGYKSIEEVLGRTVDQFIVLEAAITGLDEVVVVGYGTQKRTNIIGSVEQIGAEDINNRSVTSLSQALTGQMAGVTVIQRSGQPGSSGGTINIRGVGSFGAGTGALILVDGIPANSFNDIDPNDIASVSVLKDASSAAIYGARAANGVILVTTKSGTNSTKNVVNYHGYLGVQTPTSFPEFINSWEYAQAINEATPGGGGYTAEEIEKFKSGTDPDFYPNADYMGAFFKDNSQLTAHSISISNRGEKADYNLAVGYLDQNGILENNNFKRYNSRLNIVSKIRENLKITTRLNGTITDDKQPNVPATLDFSGMTSLIAQVIRYPSIYPISLSDGSWGAGVINKGNPISFLKSGSFYQEKGLDYGINSRLDWEVVDGLTLSAIGGYTGTENKIKIFRASQLVNANIMLEPSTLSQANPSSNYKTGQLLADYVKGFGDHNIGLLAGYSFEKGYNSSLSAFRQDFPTNDLTELNVGSAVGQTNNGTASEWALESLFGRARYNFREIYLLEGTVRYDGSSRFPNNTKYAIFPSVAVGYRISEEAFFRDNISVINDLKFKASYGVLGNQNIGNYPYQSILSTGRNYPFGNALQTGVALGTIVDEDLKWESTRTSDIGIEGALLDNRLTFGLTYFDRHTYDILVSPSASVSTVLGFNVGVQNSGKLSNKGWELNLRYGDRINELSYAIEFNGSTVKNRVIDLGVGTVYQPNGMIGNGSIFVNHPLEIYYGYLTDGLFTDQNDIDSWFNQSAIAPGSKPGDLRYRDISGPDGVPDGKVDATYDRVVLGSRIPKYSYGINLSLNYKNFDFGALVQGVGGAKGYLDNYAGFALYQNGNIQRWQYDNRWTEENRDRNAEYPRMELIPNTGTSNTLVSDYWTQDASYVRLKNVQIGYTLPKELLSRINVDNVRVYVNGENLHTWSSYRQGWDPEINSGGAYYPILRNFTFGLNFTF